jgi:hypothetical protein
LHCRLDPKSIALAKKVQFREYQEYQQELLKAKEGGGLVHLDDLVDTLPLFTPTLNTCMSEARTEFYSVDNEDDISDLGDERSERHVNFYTQDTHGEASDNNSQTHSHSPSQGHYHTTAAAATAAAATAAAVAAVHNAVHAVVVETPGGGSGSGVRRRSSSPGNVYDRLSAKGKQYAARRMNWAPPEVPVCKTLTLHLSY